MICTTLLIGEELLETKVLKKLSYGKYLNSWCTGKNIVTSHVTQLLNRKSLKRLETTPENRLCKKSLASVQLNNTGTTTTVRPRSATGRWFLCWAAASPPQKAMLLARRLLRFLSATKAWRAQEGTERKESDLYLVCGDIMPPPPRPSPILLVSWYPLP